MELGPARLPAQLRVERGGEVVDHGVLCRGCGRKAEIDEAGSW